MIEQQRRLNMFHGLRVRSLAIGLVCCWFVAGSSTAQECPPVEYYRFETPEDPYEDFGRAVAISGDVAVVGSHENRDSGDDNGYAYIYRNSPPGSDVWEFEARFGAWDRVTDQDRDFAMSVAISGDVAVCGARRDVDQGINAGAVYVFRFDGSAWIEEQKIFALDSDAGDLFGGAVAISGNIIVVGAERHDNGAGTGAAYVFRYDGVDWVEEAELGPFDGGSGRYYGNAVAISGEVIVVGRDRDSNAIYLGGAAYVYRYDSLEWVSEAKLTASDFRAEQLFGTSVTIDDDVIAIGAPGDDANGWSSGAAYVFQFDGVEWNEQNKLIPADNSESDFFGWSVAISGREAVVGAKSDSDLKEYDGSAYEFRFDGLNWVEKFKMVAIDRWARAYFGSSVATNGQVAFIGAPNSRSVSVFRLAPEICIGLGIEPEPLVAGDRARFSVNLGVPLKKTYLVYGLNGLGPKYVPFLNITIDVNRPTLLGAVKVADAAGNIDWIVNIPRPAAGLNIWLQAVQFERKTNVIATTIE